MNDPPSGNYMSAASPFRSFLQFANCNLQIAGTHKFTAVHVKDAAAAYMAALHHAVAGGTYNVGGEQGITHQQIAEAISKKLSTAGGPVLVRSINMEEASALFTPNMARIFSANNDLDSTRARTELQWVPKRTRGFTSVLAMPGSA